MLLITIVIIALCDIFVNSFFNILDKQWALYVRLIEKNSVLVLTANTKGVKMYTGQLLADAVISVLLL